MTTTGTSTATSTFTRLEILSWQIDWIVRSLTEDRHAYGGFATLVDVGIRRNKWIEIIIVYGLNRQDEIVAQLMIHVDWERHLLHVESGRDTVVLDRSLPEGKQVSNKLSGIVEFFRKALEEKDLQPRLVFCYRKGLQESEEERDQILGAGTSPPLKWSGQPVVVASDNPKKLDELTADLTVAVPRETPAKGRHRGVVRRVIHDKGFGFIRCEELGSDVFVHESQMTAGSLAEGAEVEFTAVTHPKGFRAANVTRV